MKWEVTVVPSEAAADGSSSFQVDAGNWMDALKSGFDRLGQEGNAVKIVSCQIREDHSICITEFTTKSVFEIKPVDVASSLPPVPEKAGESFLESKRSLPREEKVDEVSFMKDRGDLPPVPPALVQHDVFYEKNEDPGPGNDVVYRERVISVSPDASKEDIAVLLQYYFESLKRQTGDIQGNKYVNIAVYDHQFKGNPKGLSLATLSWQNWKSPAPQIVYPREEAEKQAAAPPSPAPQAAKAPQPAARAPSRQPPPAPQKAPRERARSSELRLEEFDADQVLTEVFEELQDMFLTQTQEEAADFVLSLATKKIPAEAGTVFLADINTRDMTFAAVKGPKARHLKGRKLIMTKGIVGFAAREGAAIAISDVRKDPRFCSDFDQTDDFITKSVLCAPIQYEGRTFGAIELVNRQKGDMFTQGEINVVTYLASQLAEYIATSIPTDEEDLLGEEGKGKPRGKRPPAAKKGKSKKTRK